MSSDKQPTITLPHMSNTVRSDSPTNTGFRNRTTSQRTPINTETNQSLPRRRSSFFSENLSDTHRSFRSSTDDLLLPRVRINTQHEDSMETSHWHSVPLGLALLPAVGGLFFKNGSAVVTDVTLLGLAAIFLNWALRLPWEWYRAAQATTVSRPVSPSPFTPIEEETDDTIPEGTEPTSNGHSNVDKKSSSPVRATKLDPSRAAAQQELRLHEIGALFACFIFPLLGAWLLHEIRSQLSRPSEGLVSNYNLTIFILVAELRPLSHMMKLVQRRTLFLQRKVNSGEFQEQNDDDKHKILDLTSRLEELETHVADAAASSATMSAVVETPDKMVAQVSSQASSDLRKALQPELDALNRAMRRYEKRMTISAIQVEARLQDLETRLKDVVVLAAAAQRNSENRPHNFVITLSNWVCAMVVVPVQLAMGFLSLPSRMLQMCVDMIKRVLHIPQKPKEVKDSKAPQRPSSLRTRSGSKRTKGLL